jgi:decaprenylphospho-beta-D-erythro-pentofuranosid-2-ulose 2-reductase
MSTSPNIFISGATSAMAQAFARRFAGKKARYFLLGRNQDKLDIVKQDLLARGAAEVFVVCVDMAKPQPYDTIVAQTIQQLGTIDIALIAQGVMRPQLVLQTSVEALQENYQVNLLSAIELATSLANYFEQARRGSLLVVSSVAGDRGRQSNYAYGASKAALSVFTDGLRNRLFRHGVTVVTVKPGFVDTPMTAEMDKNGPLWATPEKIAEDMEKMIGKGGGVLYTPWFWRYILFIITHVPDFLFKKLSL